MEIKKLHHIGIAVKSIEKVLPIYKELLGFKEEENTGNCAYNLKLSMLKNKDLMIELMEQAGDSGIIQRFIEKRGEGVHHISYEVDNLDKAVLELKSKGIDVIPEKFPPESSCSVSQKPRRRDVFINPKHFSGVMIELCEIQK